MKLVLVSIIFLILALIVVRNINKSLKNDIKVNKKINKLTNKLEQQTYNRNMKRKMDAELYPDKVNYKRQGMKSSVEAKDCIKKSAVNYASTGGLKKDVASIARVAADVKLHNFSDAIDTVANMSPENNAPKQIESPKLK